MPEQRNPYVLNFPEQARRAITLSKRAHRTPSESQELSDLIRIGKAYNQAQGVSK